MKLIVPLILSGLGAGVGFGVGSFMYTPEISETDVLDEEKKVPKPDKKADQEYDVTDAVDYIKLNNQFVVPLIAGGNVVSLVVLSLSLEVDPGNEEMIYEREPKIRDALLRVLFDHANAGGFSGDFTRSTNMIVLRDSLLEISRKTLGEVVRDVLIVDLIRQDT